MVERGVGEHDAGDTRVFRDSFSRRHGKTGWMIERSLWQWGCDNVVPS
jgi:hypothetical protein